MNQLKLPPRPPRAVFLLVTALLAFLLAGCFESDKPPKVAGGDDFPNGVEPLGKRTAEARADSADWNGFDTLPRSAPGLYDTVQVPDKAPDTSGAGPAPKRSALAKRTAAADSSVLGGLPGAGPAVPPLDTVVTRVLDTVTGTVETVRTQVTDSGSQVDSTVFIPADPATPGAVAGVAEVTRRITSADSGRVDLWRFVDADGDGILSPRAGSRNVARVELTSKAADGTVEVRSRLLAAGPDLDFNRRDDNRLLAGADMRMLEGDTLSLVRLLDADGDSALIDFAKDTNLVDVVEETRFGEGSAIVSVSRTIRLVAMSRDSSRNYPVRYAERRVFQDGAVLDISARGDGPDSAFRPGAEARWLETRYGAPADSSRLSSRAFVVRLAAVPGAFAGNVLLGVRREEAYRPGRSLEAFAFDFRPESPVPDGGWISAGDVVSWVVLPDGGRVTFAGIATAAGLEGQVTGPDGVSAAIRFDSTGAIRSSP